MIAHSISLHLPSMYREPGTVLSAFHVLAHRIQPQPKRLVWLSSRFIDEETETVSCIGFEPIQVGS